MKTSSEADQKLTRSRAVNCFILNQLATPGLGSLLVGRKLAGAGQLSLAVAGFCLLMGWFAKLFINIFHEFNGAPPYTGNDSWLWKVGLTLFVAAWCWSLVTSLGVLRAVPKEDAVKPGP